MIFKSIEDEASESGLRITNSFREAFSSEKFLTFGSDQTFSAALDNDRTSLQNYISAVQGGMSEQEAFNQHMFTASSAATEYARSMSIQNLDANKFVDTQRAFQVQLSAGDKSLGNVKTLLNEYNSALDETNGGLTKCGLSQQEFVSAVGQSNTQVGGYLSSLGGAEASMSGYVGSLVSAKVASIGMQAATMALNAAISMGLAVAISAAIQGIMALADAMDHSFSKAVERAADSKRAFEDAKSGVDDLDSQIADIDAQLSELETKSITDPQDVKNLEKQKELLEAQRDIKQQIADQEGAQAEKDARNALTETRMVDDLFMLNKNGQQFAYYAEEMDAIDETKRKQEELDAVTSKYNQTLIKLSKTNPGDKGRDLLENDLETYKKRMETLQTEVTSKSKDIAEQVDTLSQFSGNDDLIERAKEVYNTVEEGVKELKLTSDVAEGMDLNLSEILGKDSDGFTGKIDDYIVKTNELDNALEKLRNGNLTNSDIAQLTTDFPELAGQTDNLDNAIVALMEDMDNNAAQEFSSQMENIKTAGGVAAMNELKESILGVGEAAVDVDELMNGLKSAQEFMTNLPKAITESNGSTGLSIDNMQTIDSMFSDIEGYDQSALFINTATGIHLNKEELDRLNEAYAKDEAQRYSDSLTKLNQELALAKEQQQKYAEFKDSTNEADQAKKELYESYGDTITGLEGQIAEIQQMAAAWQGTTNAYNEYVQATSAGNERDSLQGLAKDRESIKNAIDEGWGDSQNVQSYLDLMLGEDRPQKASEAWEKLGETIGNTGHSLSDYMQTDDSGNLQAENVKMWFDDIAEVAGEGFTKIADDGTRTLDLTGNNVEILAEKFHTSAEFITLLAQALDDASNTNVDFGNVAAGVENVKASVEQAAMTIEDAKSKLSVLQEAGKIDEGINLDINVDTASTDELKSTLDQLGQVKIDTEVDPEGAAALEKLKAEIQQEYLIRINTQTDGQLEEAQKKIEAIKSLIGDQSLNVALQGDDGGKIKELAGELEAMPKEVKTAVNIEPSGDVDSILAGIEKNEINIPAHVQFDKSESDAPNLEPQTVPVHYEVTADPAPEYEPINEDVLFHVKPDPPPKYDDIKKHTYYKVVPDPQPTYNDIHRHVYYHVHRVGGTTTGSDGGSGSSGQFASGTMLSIARKDGTMRNVLNWRPAYVNGKVALSKDETALVNELGTESLIRNGQWMMIPGGMHMEKLQKGDIILSAEQTRSLLNIGKATGHGHAYASGTLSNAYARGSKKKGGGKKTLEKFQDWLSSLFDWIEIRLERQTDKISRYVKKADAALDSQRYGTATRNYNNAINATVTQIEYQQTAAGRYQSQADKILNRAVKKRLLSRSKANAIRKGVANGTLDISEYNEKIREVAKDYQTWAEKAIDARDAIADLHDKVREYIKDLKDVREEQRKARIDRYETFQDIATSTYTSDAGSYYKLSNGQLSYNNSVLRNTNRAYSAEVTNVAADNKRIQSRASKALRNQLSANLSKSASSKTSKKQRAKIKKYNVALEKAQQYIKGKKAIPDSVLNVIKKNSINVYEQLYAYNLSLENLETAKLERASIYAANSAEFFENIAEQYENLDDANKNRMDLNEKKSDNARSATEANKFLDKVAKGYDTIIKNDKAEVRRYTKYVNSSTGKIMGKTPVTKKFGDLSSKKQKEVVKLVRAAQAKVKRGVTISTDTLSGLARYNSEGYVTDSFYNACITYNNALEHKRQAEAQLEIDEQTRIQEREAIASEKFSNIEQEYGNNETQINSARSLTEAKQKTKTTTGRMLSASDYNKSIAYNEQSIANYRAEIEALNKSLKKNKKLYGENSQKYQDDLKTLNDYKVKLQELITTNEELTNSIIQIPYDKISDSLEKLDTIADYHKSIYDLKTAQSQDLLESEYLQQIADNQAIIVKYREQMAQLNDDLQHAKDNGGYYGGKSVTDWRKELREAATNLNQVEIENEKLKDSLRDDVYWRDLERAEESLERIEDILSGIENLVSDDMYFDKNGNITEWGIDQIATLTKQFENARDQVDNYSNQIQNLNDLYADGQYTELEYTEKLGELQKKLLDSAASMKKYLNSIKEMYKDMDKAELDALFKLIDARAEALEKKKSYYDYDKTIRDKTKDIQELQSELAALAGMNDAVSKGERAKLEAELAEKQEDLEDTLADHGIELSKDALSDMKDILQEAFDDKWDNITQDLDAMKELLSAANELTSANMANITESLNKLLSFYGINATATGVTASYASGTKRVPHKLMALTQERGSELLVTKAGMITPLNSGDGVVPAELTQRLYDMATGRMAMNIKSPVFSSIAGGAGTPQIVQNYDSLITVQGSVDAAVVSDLEKFTKDVLQKSYDYTSTQIRRDFARTGGLRKL